MSQAPRSQATSSDSKSETVARRIVLRRDVWDQLVHLADLLKDSRDLDVTPTDVAVIALEAGLREVQGLRPKGEVLPVAAAKPRARAKKGATHPTPSRRIPRKVQLTSTERSELEHLLAEQGSARGRQRTIALWLGVRRNRIERETLRTLATSYEAYNVANFAQNMKKDGQLFREAKVAGRRVGWRLSRTGKEAAEALLEGALAVA
jgi:hypothetical protein